MKKANAPHPYNVGDKVVITEANIEKMRWSARQSVHPGYPSDQFIENASVYVGEVGTVHRLHEPGYEITVQFGVGGYFHMKDNWVTPA